MTFLIAEIGSNFTTKKEARISIEQAKKSGADAVKFQMFSGEELYGRKVAAYGLPRAWIGDLKACADSHDIEFMCTAFSVDGLRFLNRYVLRHKIASAECMWPDLRQAAIDTGKQLLISTGGCSRQDIVDIVKNTPKERTTIMYCSGSYPARYTNLSMITWIKSFADSVGFSDHSIDVLGAPYAAVTNCGIDVLEKHVTAFPELASPDRIHSITMKEFKYLVQAIRCDPMQLPHPTPEEETMVKTWRRTHARGWFRGTNPDSI